MTVRLRPGSPVLRRDATTLQVGLDAPRRAVLADTPAVRRLLGDLSHGRARRDPHGDAVVAAAWNRLGAAELIVAADPVVRRPAARGASPGGAADGATVLALQAWSGPDAARRLEDRSRLRVRLAGDPTTSAALAHVLRGSGVALVADGDPCDLQVLAGRGEPRRSRVDALVREGLPHLLLWSRDALPRVGPFVVPGATACLRCVDGHEAETDPRRPLLLEQAADAAEAGDAPLDPVLLALATATAARDVLRYAEGELPLSWSATVRVAPSGLPEVARWSRHGHCGCSWDAVRPAG